ncbi:hypothetical protein QR680_010486 [Steinernema hermaphroditum]|uniref:C-type lectin domain-containing protein n=1 Tax=Steinernema hermaphroditum TaxID=289476 RepID=A0AA39IRV2_9BILA|nr:hypothetical protein QR680_010486 [Steinernema hermaphroditum]
MVAATCVSAVLFLTAFLVPASGNLHVAFIADSSESVGKLSFDAYNYAIEDLFVQSLPNDAAVAVFSEDHPNPAWKPLDAVVKDGDFQHLTYSGEPRFDPAKSLQNVINETTNLSDVLVFIATNSNLQCPGRSFCRTVAALKERGATVATFRYTFTDTGPLPELNIASEGFALTSEENMYVTFKKMVQRGNWTSSSKSTPVLVDERKRGPSATNANVVRGGDKRCSGDRAKMAIDIYLLLDSSQSIGNTSFQTVKSTASDMFDQLTFGQNGYNSRLAIVNVGDEPLLIHRLDDTTNTDAALRSIEGVPYLDAKSANLHGAFSLIGNLVKNRESERPVLVVLMSDQHVGSCDGPHIPDLCRSAAQFYDAGSANLSTLASPCASFTNNEQLPSQFHHLLSSITCFCPSPWHQFKLDACTPTTSCVRPMESFVKYTTAQRYCKNHGGSLVTILSQAKNDFVTGLTDGVSQFYVGLTIDPYHTFLGYTTGRWDSGDNYIDGVSYGNFVAPPTLNSCTVTKKGIWASLTCDDETHPAKYVCEVRGIDADVH